MESGHYPLTINKPYPRSLPPAPQFGHFQPTQFGHYPPSKKTSILTEVIFNPYVLFYVTENKLCLKKIFTSGITDIFLKML